MNKPKVGIINVTGYAGTDNQNKPVVGHFLTPALTIGQAAMVMLKIEP